MPGDAFTQMGSETEILRTLVDNIPAMLAYWDSGLRCGFANRAYVRWFGVTPESLIGRHISELLGPLYRLNLPYIERALQGEPQEFEREIPDPFGGPSRYSLAHYIPHVVHGVVQGFFVLVSDISPVKRAEMALRESEERFRLTIEEAPIGMALVALDGRFIRVNRVLCEIVGYTADELTGLTFQAITHPDDLETDLALAAQLARGEIPRYRLGKRYVRKDGTTVDVTLSGSALRRPDGTPIMYIAQIEDVTERRRLENETRLAEARSSGILSISADAIISIDDHQRITLFNDGAVKIFGYSRAEAIGMPLDRLIPERLWAVHREHVLRLATGEQTARHMGDRSAPIVGVRKNGEEFPADAAISKLVVGGTTVLTASVRDTSEQTRVAQLQRFLADAGTALAGTLDYSVTLSRVAELAVRDVSDLCIVEVGDDADDDIRRVNVASRDPEKAWLCDVLKGMPLDRRRPHLMHSVLQTRRTLLIPNVSADTVASFAQSEEHHRALQAAEIRSLVVVPLVAHGRLVGAMAFISSSPSRVYGPADVQMCEAVAERAAMSINSARLYRSAQRATEARDEVLGVVAHDLRNPLNNILVRAALLQRVQGPEASRRSAEMIERAATRMNSLIQDLLDVARVDAGQLTVHPSALSVEELVGGSVETHLPIAAAASVELGLDIAPGLPAVWADQARLLQVFDNLIGNAVKFTGPGGRITVGATPGDDVVLFRVTDTGSGIPAEHLPHVFDRFWQATKGERRGSGLGLSIVKAVVQAHGGRIWVESVPGKGSTFRFTIPVAWSDAPAVTSTPPA